MSRRKARSTPPRIRPLPLHRMKPAWVATLNKIPGTGLKGNLFPKNVLGTLMHNPDTFGPFLEYWVVSKLRMHLTVREQELVILRMGALYRCQYVWKHHVPVAREFGVTEPEIAALRRSRISSVFMPRERALLELTDELVERRTLRPALWKKHAAQLKKAEWVDLVGLVSQYVLFALTNNAFRVELEESLRNVPGI